MAGTFTVRSQLTGGTQFSDASPIVTFSEFTDLVNTGISVTARILGYSYNSQGAAHDVILTLRPSGAAAVDERIILEERLAADSEEVNSFTNACGPGGIVVPRNFGIVSVNNQPPSGFSSNAQSYQLFLSTANKAADATFICWYSVEEIDD